MNIVDAHIRKQALNCAHSYIIQAPAGSGKTELLTQRFLTLLAHAPQAPEEVLAITFTRKAASEMRQRVAESLERAATQPQPTTEPAATNWSIARQVVMRDQRAKWQLLDSPNRLRIMTIDAFCNSLIRQMPLLSELGTVPTITDQSDRLYQLAASFALEPIQRNTGNPTATDPYLHALKTVLTHLDNQVDRLQSLIASMLARRDQWLIHVSPYLGKGEQLRNHLQQALDQIVAERMKSHTSTLANLMNHLGEPFTETQLRHLLEFAYSHLTTLLQPDTLAHHPFTRALNSDQSIAYWQAISHLLITRSSTTPNWRKSRGINKNLGFINPATLKNREEQLAAKEAKATLKTILDQLNALTENGQPTVMAALCALDEIAQLPTAGYRESQWAVIESLITLLVRAVAELKLVFQQEGQVDFSEIGMAAQRALGEEEQPTDLALKLDYQIQHILIDEFQDTSISQFELLKGLTRGWQSDDGRTLFLVGDPMQSIYRFREADVSLFLKARNEGVGPVKLQFLQLQNNFRSYPKVIDWVNRVFTEVLPEHDDLITGAVAYSESVAGRAPAPENPVEIALDLYASEQQLAAQMVKTIAHLRATRPEERIALLIRARPHATRLLSLLRAHGLPYQAVEIDALADKPLIQDLLSLTKAIYYWSDRIAWLAILRAPWCGLSLTDLHALVAAPNGTASLIWEACLASNGEQLSDTGWQRLQHFRNVFTPLLAQRYRYSVRETVESSWIALGGIRYTAKEDLPDAERFFERLESLEAGWDIVDIDQLEQSITRLFANPAVTDLNPIQVMTIHKAKGLEFDSVFIPHLEKAGRYDDAALLSWLRQEHPDQDTDLLLFAPIKESYGEDDKINDFIRKLERQKSAYELGRLFYVATTRAKRALYLGATLNLDESEATQPEFEKVIASLRKDSLLSLLPEIILRDAYSQLHCESKPEAEQLSLSQLQSPNADFWRIPDAAFAQSLYPSKPTVPLAAISIGTLAQVNEITDHTTGEQKAEQPWKRIVGTVLHRLLENYHLNAVGQPIAAFDPAASQQIWTIFLLQAGLPHSKLTPALNLLERAWQSLLQCERAQWIFAEHLYAENELEIALQAADFKDNQRSKAAIQRYRIDRLFLEPTDELGAHRLWIIDYKLSEPTAEQTVASFYQQQTTHYRDTLHLYGEAAFTLLQANYSISEVKVALYFPLFQGWVEWDLATSTHVRC